ncbi:MAG: GNAT family N-acetyltransferase [Bacteroidetes bacterium]|nr:GNAT family N-acetyltransferase [Bacteroidota bacterium]
MDPVIPPVSRALLEKELTPDRFVKNTKNSNNQIFIVDHENAPNVMEEIGRLREITFRLAGGGTGKPIDIDEFDVMENPFYQLLVWDPAAREIVGGYRFITGARSPVNADFQVNTPTAELFRFSEKFAREYWPKTIELGRSFVQPAYQPSNDMRKGLFSLDNIWDGLGALITQHPDVEYFFGKITMYPHYNQYARDLILCFLATFFPDPDQLVVPITPLPYWHDARELSAHFTGATYEENYKILVQEVRKRNENIPPLVNSYMNLSSTMRTFGTAANPGFGVVEETGIMIRIEDIYYNKKERHLGIQ